LSLQVAVAVDLVISIISPLAVVVLVVIEVV
jgi:hypothetical protein